MRDEEELPSRPRKRAKVTVYDAVAGRANYEGFLSVPRASKYRDKASTTLTPIPPEEVLFRRRGAPERYEENDVYFADRHLDQAKELQRLPDSDLLKALHAYASDFYARASEGRGEHDWESLDETALLALGILIEEAAAQICVENVASLPDEVDSTLDIDATSGRVKAKSDSDEGSVGSEIEPESDEESVGSGIKEEPND